MSTASAKNEARAAVAMLAELGNKIVSFRGGDGVVATTGYIERGGADIGFALSIGEARWIATLLAEDVGEVHRGDRLTDEDGQEWELLEEMPFSDDFVIDWTVQKR